MQESTGSSSSGGVRPARPRRGQWAFLAVALAVGAAVWWFQRDGGTWEGWEQDLPAALRQAAAQDRPLLVLFTSDPIDYDARRMRQTTLAKKENRQAIQAGRYLPVVATVRVGLKDELSVRHALQRLPTMLVLSPKGKELARAEGFVGETDFRQKFLRSAAAAQPGR